jgi:signal transduction histidine kinase
VKGDVSRADQQDHQDIMAFIRILLLGVDKANTGIGLTIARTIVRTFHVKVSVDSAVGEGTRCYFTFPKGIR